MKRMGKCALALLLAAVLLCGSVLAAGETYVIEGKGVEITEPEGDYYILTRGMDPEDPAFAGVGMTARQVDEAMESYSAYLVAVSRDGSYQIQVCVVESEDLGGLSDYDMIGRHRRNEMVAAAEERFADQGITLAGGVTWYEEGEVPYMVIEATKVEGFSWSYQYQTLYAGRMVVIAATPGYLGEITDEVREATRRIAECVHYPYRIVWLQSIVKAYDEFCYQLPDMIGTVAVIVIAGLLGCGGWNRLRKKGKKSMSAVPAENEASTGGNDL